MRTFSINTFGCKVNQYESRQICQLLESLGLQMVRLGDEPDLAVVNTCCVTHTAAGKSRRCLTKAQKHNPHAAIVICGCLPAVQTGEIGKTGENVHLIRRSALLAATLVRLARTRPKPQRRASLESPLVACEQQPGPAARRNPPAADKNEPDLLELPALTSFTGHTKAFLKVQDGCDGRCTYCIVPKTRPNVCSKPLEAAVKEAESLVRAGHREIVVTGVFLGAYGRHTVRRNTWPTPENDNLAQLLDKMAQIPGLDRIRLSSLEPGDITETLLRTLSAHPNIMPHLHLSLQSGSNSVLKLMARQYTVEQFIQKTEIARAWLDRPAITTDLIVGFPGETDADFEQTVKVARHVGFAKMHIFRFSPRKGTPAERLQSPINTEVIKERSRILRNLDNELGMRFRRQFVGQADSVLIESTNGQAVGRSRRYFNVTVQPFRKCFARNDLLDVRLLEATDRGMVGKLLQADEMVYGSDRNCPK